MTAKRAALSGRSLMNLSSQASRPCGSGPGSVTGLMAWAVGGKSMGKGGNGSRSLAAEAAGS